MYKIYKSIAYKEWIKTRWFMISYTLLGLTAIGIIFLKLRYDIKFIGAVNIWNNIIFKNYAYYSTFKFIPLMGGITLGFSQFIPEIINKRLKLSFHLPINENRLLVHMVAFGSIMLSVSYIILFALSFTFSLYFFPKEIIINAIISTLPWFLTGFTAYYLLGLILLEPTWRLRFLYALIASLFISIYLIEGNNGAFVSINPLLATLSISCSIALIFSGYRFRKGIQ